MKKNFSLRIETDLYKKLTKISEHTGLSISAILTIAILNYLKTKYKQL